MANVTRYGSFDSLPADVDDKATVAKYQDGVLDLTLPKKSGNGPHCQGG